MKEQWRDIKGYEGLYQVSNQGRIKGFRVKDGFVGFKIVDEGKVMSLINKENGYKYITLVKDGTRKNYYIHRLVAQAFIGDIPTGLVVNHIDHNRGNNCVDNLEIITQMQNTHHSRHLMKKPRPHKDKNFYIRFKDERYEVTVNRKYLGRFTTIEQARKVRDEYIKKINYYR